MKIYILYDNFDYKIEKASCNGRKLQALCDEYNGVDDLGPYCVVPIELEDFYGYNQNERK